MSENNEKIQCTNHGKKSQWFPWSVVCIHLMTAESKKWVPIKSDHPEVDYDWLCPDCSKKFDEESEAEVDHNIVYFRAVCIHCVQKLRQAHDKNWAIRQKGVSDDVLAKIEQLRADVAKQVLAADAIRKVQREREQIARQVFLQTSTNPKPRAVVVLEESDGY